MCPPRDTQTQFCLSLYGVSGSWCTQGLFEPFECLWWEWGLILNVNLPPHHHHCLAGAFPLPWTLGISSKFPQHCSAAAPAQHSHPSRGLSYCTIYLVFSLLTCLPYSSTQACLISSWLHVLLFSKKSSLNVCSQERHFLMYSRLLLTEAEVLHPRPTPLNWWTHGISLTSKWNHSYVHSQ